MSGPSRSGSSQSGDAPAVGHAPQQCAEYTPTEADSESVTEVDSESESVFAGVGIYQAGQFDVTNGRCWYTWEWLEGEAEKLLKALDDLGDEEYKLWATEYNRFQDHQDKIHLEAMCGPNLAFRLPGSDPHRYVERCQNYLTWRAGQRQLAMSWKREEIDKKVWEAYRWWVSRGGAPNAGRRLEQGLSGLNPIGAARGAGGGL